MKELFLTHRKGISEYRIDTVIVYLRPEFGILFLGFLSFSLFLPLLMMTVTPYTGIISSFQIPTTYIPFSPRGMCGLGEGEFPYMPT